jgi:uncharacterized membrane protein
MNRLKKIVPVTKTLNNPTNSSYSDDLATSSQKSSESALKVLKLRFVKGEITKEEFEEMKKELE